MQSHAAEQRKNELLASWTPFSINHAWAVRGRRRVGLFRGAAMWREDEGERGAGIHVYPKTLLQKISVMFQLM